MNQAKDNEPAGKDLSDYRGQSEKSASLPEIHNRCECNPPISFQHCPSLFNPWLRNKLSQSQRKGGLIAYIRTTDGDKELNQQAQILEEYCLEHGYRISKAFRDHGAPGHGLQEALDAVDEAAGLIAVDLDRFVENSSDRLRSLRPFVHHFLHHTEKHLITVAEGIDTRSPAGQLSALELINDMKGSF